MYDHKSYLIETLTNTHVGGDDTGFSVADKVIQKDPVTEIPVFHASSVKGAFRDHLQEYVAEENDLPPESDLIKRRTFKAAFGEQEMGLLKFYEARLLTLPLRSTVRPYFNATSPAVLKDYLDMLNIFEVEGCEREDLNKFGVLIESWCSEISAVDFAVFNHEGANPVVEDYPRVKKLELSDENARMLCRYLSPRASAQEFIKSLAVFNDAHFKDICGSALPIIARNKLDEGGKSENLFYEETLPRRSVLCFMLGYYRHFNSEDESQFTKGFEKIEARLLHDKIQLGGNASIGYGVCSISRLPSVSVAAE